jgi:uncharacterized membrane protein
MNNIFTNLISNMSQEVKVSLIVLVVFLTLDLPMILLINKKMYQKQLEKINGENKVKLGRTFLGASVTYLLLALGIYYFAVKQNNIYNGAILGLVIYGVYNFTNLATIAEYGFTESVIDTAWGTILCALVAFFALLISNRLVTLPAGATQDVLTTTEVPSR